MKKASIVMFFSGLILFIISCGTANYVGIIASAMLIGISTASIIELDTPPIRVKRSNDYVEPLHKLPKRKP